MVQFPLTPEGVADKIVALYALSNNNLAIEADSIEEDFAGWMKVNFSLTVQQASYLDSIDEQVRRYYGFQSAFCFRNRLDIQLVYPFPPVDPGYSKWLDVTDTIIVEADGAGGVIVSGGLLFTVAYR